MKEQEATKMNGDDAGEQRAPEAPRAEGDEESITQVPTTDKLQTQEVQNPMANLSVAN